MKESISETKDHCAGLIDIIVSKTPEPEIRFISDKTIYVEGLLKGRWVGRYWSANGHISKSAGFWESDAFEIRIKEESSGPEIPGKLLSTGWEFISALEVTVVKKGSRHFVVNLSSKIAPINIGVHTLLDGTPVLTRWLEITNTGKRSIAITEVFPWSGRLWAEDSSVTLGHALKWQGGWEGWFGWTPLEPGRNVFEQHRGLVFDVPYFMLRNEANGQYFFGQLAWPVNYCMEFHRESGLSFKVGPRGVSPFRTVVEHPMGSDCTSREESSQVNAVRVIAPKETVKTPTVHLGYIKEDFNVVVQSMHEHIRRSVLPKRNPERAYLVQYTIPEDQGMSVYRGDNYNEENFRKCMDVAAAIGAEAFIVDGPTWAEGFGNWVPKKKWFPNGFGTLVEYAHEKGLLFGVYAEVEGGRGDWSQTDAFKEHPEWFVSSNPDYPGNNFLKIVIPEAADYMESELTQLIENHQLDIYRHDQNGGYSGDGSWTARDGFVENDYWRHYEAFYAMTERIADKYPDLILQQASGGGTRLDIATAAYWHEHYTSDVVSMPKVFQMSAGLSVYLPTEILVTPNGMSTALPDFVTLLRAIFALGNTPFIFNGILPRCLEDLPPTVMEKWMHYSNLYKKFIRPLLPTCKVYHHDPVNATGGVESEWWFAMEFMSPDREKGWALIVSLYMASPNTYLFKPRGLNKKRKYMVTFDNTGKTEEFDGLRLMRDGLLIHIRWQEGKPASELLLFELKHDT